jgi:hypothetical protein
LIPEISFVPDSLSAAQNDMLRRMPKQDASALESAEFHRYNAKMFQLAGDRLAQKGRALEDDWTSRCVNLQRRAARMYMDQFYREQLSQINGDDLA